MFHAEERERRTYPEIAEAILQSSNLPDRDLEELRKRMVLNVIISNIDDHRRNHGFYGVLQVNNGICYLCMMLEPVPPHIKLNIPATAIFESGEVSLQSAVEDLEFFHIKPRNAKEIITVMLLSDKYWRILFNDTGLAKEEMKMMSPSFFHDLTQGDAE